MKLTIGLGNILAVVISYTTWHSVAWALIHGFFGWFYVVYFVIVH